MEVTHQADHITHAIIGGSDTIEYKISNDAAFFQILSTALYSDQKLAVAREVLCNAWDAHIRAGLTDTPIKVTIDNEKIVVRDYAVGIAPEMMGPLYGTYGGTDKTNNGEETGGFGLGCKAPYAYTEHFEVISWHQGIKTIYRLSKSSADKHGKPGITPIVSVPTSETGLQVTIPLKTRHDTQSFITLFEQIAFNGEMLVEVNSKISQKLPLSKGESNWLITTNLSQNSAQTSKIMVRYGNVIYPVAPCHEFQGEYTNVLDFVQKLNYSNYVTRSYSIVFQAEPNSISVTPSRESLSMQEHTIRTIKGLLQGFLAENLQEKIAVEAVPFLESQIEKCVKNRNFKDLLTDVTKIPGVSSSTYFLSNINTIAELTKQFVNHQYPSSRSNSSFYKKDMALRIDAAISLGVGSRGHLETVKRIVTLDKKNLQGQERRIGPAYTTSAYKAGVHGIFTPNDWFKRHVVRPLYRDMTANPAIEPKRLRILSGAHYRNSSGKPEYTHPAALHFNHVSNYLPYLRKVMVISYSQFEIWARIRKDQEVMKMAEPGEVWFYHAPMATTKIQAARDFFKAQGFIVVDYTSGDNWEKHKIPKEQTTTTKRAPKPKLEGYAALSGIWARTGTYRHTRVDNCFYPDAPRVLEPKCFLEITPSRMETRFFILGLFSGTAALRLARMFGDVCAVVKTKPQAELLKKAGLIEFDTFVANYVSQEITKKPSFLAYWPECLNRGLGRMNGATLSSERHSYFVTLFERPEVRALFGLKSNLNEQELRVLRTWQAMQDQWHYYDRNRNGNIAYQEAEAAYKLIRKMPISKRITEIADLVMKSPYTDILDDGSVRKLLKDPNAKADGHIDRVAKLVHTALMG